MRWHHNPAQWHQIEQRRQQHRPGGAERDQREVAGVDTTPDGAVTQALGDVVEPYVPGVADPLAQRQSGVQLLERGARLVGVERHRAAEETVLCEHPGEQRRIGERRPLSPVPVTSGPRVGPGAVRPDLDLSGGADRHDAAAAGAERDDVGGDGVDDQVVLQLEHRVDPRLAVDDEAEVGGGAADVGAEQVGVAAEVSEVGTRHGAGRWAADDEAVRLFHRDVGGHQPRGAVGVVEGAGEAHVGEAGREPVCVVGVRDLHDHVYDGRRRPGVLLGQRGHLAGQ